MDQIHSEILIAALRGYLERRNYRKLLLGNELRGKLIREIYETEKTYVHNIESIIKDYLLPLRVVIPSIITAEVHASLFGKIEDILKVNTELLEQITERFQKWLHANPGDGVPQPFVGDIFKKLGPYLKVYSEYCANYNLAIQRYSKKMEEVPFANFVKKVKDDHPNLLDLPSLLIMPVQRVPRYKMLLTELQRRTDRSNEDYTNIEAALGKVSEVADHINETIRERENVEKILAIQKKFSGSVPPLVQPRRSFIREGTLMKVCRKSVKKRWFVVFSDALLYGTALEAVGKYTFHRLLTLSNAKVKDVPDKPKTKYAFQIICKEKSFSVCAETEEEKRSWMKTFATVLSAIYVNSGTTPSRLTSRYSSLKIVKDPAVDMDAESAPVWIPDDESEACMICQSKFTTFRRRHHCRRCGNVVCGKCSDNTFKLETINRLARVCDECYKILREGGDETVSVHPDEIHGDSIPNDYHADSHGENNIAVHLIKLHSHDCPLPLTRSLIYIPVTSKEDRYGLYPMDPGRDPEQYQMLPPLPEFPASA